MEMEENPIEDIIEINRKHQDEPIMKIGVYEVEKMSLKDFDECIHEFAKRGIKTAEKYEHLSSDNSSKDTKDITWNPLGLNNAVLIGKMVEAEERENELKVHVERLKKDNVNLRDQIKKSANELKLQDDKKNVDLNEVCIKHKEHMARNEKEWRKRLDEKEDKWNYQKKVYEDKLALVAEALEEYDLKLRWMEDGFSLLDVMSYEEDEE